jgi:hypothetical protein
MLGQLVSAKATEGFATEYLKQVEVWDKELVLLEGLCRALAAEAPSSRGWALLLEYPIPRRKKYPDAIILAEELIFVLEFKFGMTAFDAVSKWQVEDYALDLRDFHLQSRNRSIIPILIATDVPSEKVPGFVLKSEGASVWPVNCLTPRELAGFLASAYWLAHVPDRVPIDPPAWDNSPYRPSLSIIEAAKELFAGHSVREINHAYAGNLSRTTTALIEAIHTARSTGKRIICFVTGVPGAGKTLTGLSAIHSPELQTEKTALGVFLSGNGPLVAIVREALIRDAVAQQGRTKRESERKVHTFIQNVHDFIGEYGFSQTSSPPPEHVVVFDEAQRAWSAAQVKKKRDTNQSEPQMMLGIMERCPAWCVIIALVGGGQEIHTGEAGLEEWGRSLSQTNKEWQVLASREALFGGPSLATHRLFDEAVPQRCCVHETPSLHLDVSVRSLRAQRIAEWVNCVLRGDAKTARQLLSDCGGFPIVLTRDLEQARQWLRDRSRLERRCGLVVSSGSIRHRAYGIEVSSGFRHGYAFEEWFLGGADDIRSSYQLEVAATEFECQGLELDWVAVCWGDDLCYNPPVSSWRYRQFRGNRWHAVHKDESQRYLLNKYRVLLTRARQGMVLWVPPGDRLDRTRDPNPLDATAAFLQAAGIPPLG